MRTVFALLLLTILSCSSSKKGGLEPQVQTLELHYIAWACDCANWATQEDIEENPHNYGDSLAMNCIFVEPANSSLALPDSLHYPRDVIRFTGQFYRDKGFPKNYYSFQDPEPARVFRYTSYVVVRSNYKDYKNLE